MVRELQVIADFYDLMLWLIQRIEKFPRHYRYSLGTSMEQRLQTVLALLLRAKFSSAKSAALEQANLELEVLRFQVRLAKDLKLLAFTSHEHASKLLAGVGAQVGGWLKSKSRRDEAARGPVAAGDGLGQPPAGGPQGAAGQA